MDHVSLQLGFRFEMALLYAAQLHAGQTRKGGAIPYIAHLLGVASIVIEAGGDEDQAIAALLHDATEDQGGEARRSEIERIFGPRVTRIIAECSDESDQFPVHTPDNSAARKRWYLDHLPAISDDALPVSLADKLYNARSIVADLYRDGDAVWERFNVGKEGQLKYYRALATIFSSRADTSLRPLAADLERAVAEMGRLAVFTAPSLD